MVFHHPLPLDYNSRSASGIRPIKMLNAFKKLGYEVDLATGYSNDRKLAVRNIVNNIKNGIKYDFCYSESSTMPTLLCDKNHFPLHPFLDFYFFKILKTNDIPIGLFYRDIYWLFPEYKKRLGYLKALLGRFFYKYDLLQYSKYLSKLYLPTELMEKYIPIDKKDIFKALPPGLEELSANLECSVTDELTILYIGGLNNHYKMHELFKAVQNKKNIKLIICTRKEEWNQVKDEYSQFMSNNISVVHKSGLELNELFRKSNCTSIFVEPQKYWSFALPLKLFEYLGNYKPIIATENTYSADFIKRHNIGWAISYEKKALESLLKELTNSPEKIREKTDNCKRIARTNTWLERALQVKKDLVG